MDPSDILDQALALCELKKLTCSIGGPSHLLVYLLTFAKIDVYTCKIVDVCNISLVATYEQFSLSLGWLHFDSIGMIVCVMNTKAWKCRSEQGRGNNGYRQGVGSAGAGIKDRLSGLQTREGSETVQGVQNNKGKSGHGLKVDLGTVEKQDSSGTDGALTQTGGREDRGSSLDDSGVPRNQVACGCRHSGHGGEVRFLIGGHAISVDANFPQNASISGVSDEVTKSVHRSDVIWIASSLYSGDRNNRNEMTFPKKLIGEVLVKQSTEKAS
ncbi:hypothetical protein M5K25_001490 [Dendrobium thyrsiflorum]|uniref:Uncharacterized protein n=1 Tax=Dendrobium thyrsiflorum TaxID=117978 RepID=A0ABD0VY53_DENTH